MRTTRRGIFALATAIVWAQASTTGRAESLNQAWAIALSVNDGLQAQQAQSQASAMSLGAAQAARRPTVRNQTIDAMLTPSVSIASITGAGTTSPASAGGSSKVPGSNQSNVPISLTMLNFPIYTGGRLRANVESARAQLGAQRTEEFRTVLDLKLTVAEAYVGVLRAVRDHQVAESDVARLSAFAKDVKNRRVQGLVTRNDELAAGVSLSNAQLREIQTKRRLVVAWATYNRYLSRPLSQAVDLEDLAAATGPQNRDALAHGPLGDPSGNPAVGESEVLELTAMALRGRPELAGLVEQARSLNAQATATSAGLRPQFSVQTGYAYLGLDVLPERSFYTSALVLDWTLADFGTTKRRAASQRNQEIAALRRRDDTAADIALDVRSRWLDVQETRLRIPVARQAVTQAEENISVVTDRYRQGLSTYTEVLDAENRRVESFTNLYAANYDAVLAVFRLRRAVGDL